MKTNLMQNHKTLESKSLKFLDMMGWLIRHLITDNIDLYSILTRLGIFHQRMGIKLHHFAPILKSMHETFSYYFPTKYNIEVWEIRIKPLICMHVDIATYSIYVHAQFYNRRILIRYLYSVTLGCWDYFVFPSIISKPISVQFTCKHANYL